MAKQEKKEAKQEEKKQAETKQDEALPAKADPASQPDAAKSTPAHPDATEDIALIKKLLMDYGLIGDSEADKPVVEAAQKVKAMFVKKGDSDGVASKKAMEYMQVAKEMASGETEDETVQADEAKQDESKQEESEDEAKQEEKKESEDEGDEKCEACQKKESEILTLKGEIAKFKESDKRREIEKHLDKVLRESKLGRPVTDACRESIGDISKIKSKETIDEKFKLFSAGLKSKSVGGESDLYAGLIVSTEKMRESSSDKKSFDLSDCTK